MNLAALARLLNVREHRVEMAQAALEAARRALQTRENEAAHLQTSLERTLLTRMAQQRNFNERTLNGAGSLPLCDVQHNDQYVGWLTDEATRIGEKIVAARKAVAAAQEEVVTARRALRHAMAKRDALVKLVREARQEQARRTLRVQDEEAEEIAARREKVV